MLAKIVAAAGAALIALAPITANAAPTTTAKHAAQVKRTAHGVPLQRDGRVQFTGKAARIISDRGVRDYLNTAADIAGTSRGYEQDMMGCAVAYPSLKGIGAARYRECVKATDRFHAKHAKH